MSELFDPFGEYLSTGGLSSLEYFPEEFINNVDHDQDTLIYENFNGGDSICEATDYDCKMLADRYVDEISCGLWAYYDPDEDILVVGAHHDFSEVDICGYNGTPGDLSSYFKITSADVASTANYYTKGFAYAYADKCTQAKPIIESILGMGIGDPQCANTPCAPTSNSAGYWWTPYDLFDSTTAKKGSAGYTIYEPSEFMTKMINVAHTAGISPLQKGLHYFSFSTLDNQRIALWDGEGFTPDYASYMRANYNNRLQVQYNSVTYPWKGPRPTSTATATTPNYIINYPTLHFYCIYE